jgi:hypothetical protein
VTQLAVRFGAVNRIVINMYACFSRAVKRVSVCWWCVRWGRVEMENQPSMRWGRQWKL